MERACCLSSTLMLPTIQLPSSAMMTPRMTRCVSQSAFVLARISSRAKATGSSRPSATCFPPCHLNPLIAIPTSNSKVLPVHRQSYYLLATLFKRMRGFSISQLSWKWRSSSSVTIRILWHPHPSASDPEDRLKCINWGIELQLTLSFSIKCCELMCLLCGAEYALDIIRVSVLRRSWVPNAILFIKFRTLPDDANDVWSTPIHQQQLPFSGCKANCQILSNPCACVSLPTGFKPALVKSIRSFLYYFFTSGVHW